MNRRENIKLIDISLSRSAVPGLLLFIRLVQFSDFNMTSGISFVFPGNLEKRLLSEYKELGEKVKADNDSIKRFISFFILDKIYGLEIKYV